MIRTGLCIDETNSLHTLPSFEFGNLRTRSTNASNSLIMPDTNDTLAEVVRAHSSPFSEHWWRYLR